MSALEDRLDRELRQVAECAVVSDASWADVLDRMETEDEASDIDLAEVDGDWFVDRRSGVRARMLVGWAAAALVVIAMVAVVTRTLGESVPAGREAERVVDDFVAAFNAGDVETALAFFTDEAPTTTLADGAVEREPTLHQWELILEINAAQDAQITDVTCLPTVEATAGTTVSCEWLVHDAVTRAVDHPGWRLTAEFTIVDGEFVAWRYSEWPTEGGVLSSTFASFASWVDEFHPEDVRMFDRRDWTTPADARRYGELQAEYAVQWAESVGNSPPGTSDPERDNGSPPAGSGE